jgi:hypothetical protein
MMFFSKGLYSLLIFIFLIPFNSFSQQRAIPEITKRLILDSLTNQILYFTNDSLTRFDANSLEILETKKILKPNAWFSLLPVIKQNRLLFLNQKGGEVFELTEQDSLIRIDNSDIKNFLIGSSVFIKNDTLMRHGGYGYWTQSNFFTYLDKSTKEWEIYPISLTSKKATTVGNHFGINTGKFFYFFGGFHVTHLGTRNEVPNNEVWSFNFQSKNWNFLGILKADFSDRDFKSFTDGKHNYILDGRNTLFKVNVEQNILTEYKINPVLHLFQSNIDPVLFNDQLYYINKSNILKKVALKDITSKIEQITALYDTKKTVVYLLISFGLVFLCIAFFGIYRYIKSRNSLVILENGLKYKSKFVELDSMALTILKRALKKEVEFTEIFAIVSKNHLSKIQNERVRNQYIDKINTQIKWLLGSNNDVLIIIKSSFDARYKSVIFNKEFYDKFI